MNFFVVDCHDYGVEWYPSVLASHSLEEKAKAFDFYLLEMCQIIGALSVKYANMCMGNTLKSCIFEIPQKVVFFFGLIVQTICQICAWEIPWKIVFFEIPQKLYFFLV